MLENGISHLSEKWLNERDIRTGDVIDSLEKVIKGSDMGQVWSAPKAVITPPDGRYIMATLAAMSEPPLVATKSLVLNAKNSDINLPQINGLVSLLHGETGIPLLTVDGNWITAIRTAGLSAVAAKYLANPDSSSIGFVGSGVQARSHLKLFSDMFPVKNIKIYGRGGSNIDALSTMAKGLDLSVEICRTPAEAVDGVDLVVTSVTHTSVTEPFLDASWLSEGCFAAIVDLGAPWHKESFSALDTLIIDDLEQEASLPNKLAHPDHINGDLSALVMNRTAGRKGKSERNAFVFRGHALGDLAIAALAYKKHLESTK